MIPEKQTKRGDEEIVSFLCTLSSTGAAIKHSSDESTITLAVPQTELANMIKSVTLFDKVLECKLRRVR